MSRNEQMQLSFVFNGLFGLIGDFGQEGDIRGYQGFMDSDLGKDAVDAMKAIAALER